MYTGRYSPGQTLLHTQCTLVACKGCNTHGPATLSRSLFLPHVMQSPHFIINALPPPGLRQVDPLHPSCNVRRGQARLEGAEGIYSALHLLLCHKVQAPPPRLQHQQAALRPRMRSQQPAPYKLYSPRQAMHMAAGPLPTCSITKTTLQPRDEHALWGVYWVRTRMGSRSSGLRKAVPSTKYASGSVPKRPLAMEHVTCAPTLLS